MAVNSDLMRGVAEPVILKLLAERTMYGYEIIRLVNERTNGAFEWKEGTLYPCLHRLEEQGKIFSLEYTAEGTLLDAEVEQRDWRLYETYLRTED